MKEYNTRMVDLDKEAFTTLYNLLKLLYDDWYIVRGRRLESGRLVVELERDRQETKSEAIERLIVKLKREDNYTWSTLDTEFNTFGKSANETVVTLLEYLKSLPDDNKGGK